MERTTQLEQIIRSWETDQIADWQIIQDNVARITFVSGKQCVLKDIGQDCEEIIRRLWFEYDVLHHVVRRNLSVAVPRLSTRDVPYAASTGRIYRFSDWLPNRTAKIQANDEQVLLYRNYGKAIGRFHLALATYHDDDIENRTWKADLQKRILVEAVQVVEDRLAPEELTIFQALLSTVEAEMTKAYGELPIQLIIWDCHPGNVAVDGFEVTGFIDCDHIALAPRIFDLADFLVHLIKWDIGETQKEMCWLSNFSQLIAGYETITQLSVREREALFYAMLGIPVIFMDFLFQSGMPESTRTEMETFRWLVAHRAEILEYLEIDKPVIGHTGNPS